MIISGEEELYGMSKEYWTQCQHCGSFKKVKMQFNIDSNLFIKLWCECCDDTTPHIWTGEHLDDIYLYENVNLDSRYYEYNTK